MAVTAEDIKAKKIEVLNAQKATIAANAVVQAKNAELQRLNSELQQLTVQKQIDELSA